MTTTLQTATLKYVKYLICQMQVANRSKTDDEETHIWVSDEWIVQFGGVLVELENIRKNIISEGNGQLLNAL